ncbi:MAG TPA: sulfatase, partial [bacterium]|nr:sulfatase [bacterium]
MVRSLFRCFPVALGLVTPAPAAPAADPPPNVVIVMIDTLRPDHLALYGYGTVTSPFLDDLGDRSLVFRRATSTSSWTAPAVASLFTGLYPQQHGVTLGLQAQRTTGGRQKLSAHRLAPDVRTLPEVFRRAGYATYGISTNVNVDQALGFQRGFDRFVRLEHVPLAGIADPIAGKTPANIPATAEHVDAVLREWEPDLRAADPWLLYLHFMDPHKPYHARPPWFEDPGPDGDGTVAAYDSEIAYLDRTLARIHERLGLGGHDIVVVVSDHGEEFGDHGGHGHKGGLHRELNRIVLMISA